MKVQKLALTFQGGFVSTSINVVATIASEEGSKEVEVVLGKVFPEDVNKRQVLE